MFKYVTALRHTHLQLAVSICNILPSPSKLGLEIGCQLLLITNRNSHTGYRLVPTSMTLNDPERRNSPYFAFFSPNSLALQADDVTVVEDRPIISVKYCLPVPVFHFWPKL